MDPVVGSIIGSVLVAILSGTALFFSTRSNSTAAALQTLVNGQQASISRLDAQLVAKDSVIDDLRNDLEECHRHRARLEEQMDRVLTDLDMTKSEVARLRARVTEIGDEQIP